jgi:hypothetical protein
MELFKNILLWETQKAAEKEIRHVVKVINLVHAEWKKISRRRNAVDIITTSVNKLSTINPAVIDQIPEETKIKLAIAIMRCLDIPPWKPIDSKAKIYKKLYPLLSKVQNKTPNTGTDAILREIVMTRLSAALSHQRKDGVFVGYEPILPKSYLQHIFGEDMPKKTFRMQALPLPEEFSSLVDILTINHEKALKKFHPE